NNNQDSFAEYVASSEAAWRQRGHLFIVADGMGAHAAGELASKLAVDNIPHLYSKLASESTDIAIRKAIEQTNDKIHDRGQANAEFHGMGTTTSCLVLTKAGAYIGHVGDSRIYRLRGNRLDQLTFDHSLVWEMRRANGQFHNSEFGANLPKNIITRSLGPHAQVQVDVEGPFPLCVGDTFLLCSDGLTGPVKNEELALIIGCLPPDDAARMLVDLANLRGGPDNITVEVVKVTGEHISQIDSVSGAAVDTPDPGMAIRGLATSLLLLFGLGTVALLAVGIVLGQAWAIAAGVVCGLATAGLAVWRRKLPAPPAEVEAGRLHGGAPYDSCLFNPNAEFVEQLKGIFKELCDAARHDDWEIDWRRVETLAGEASEIEKTQEIPGTIRSYCRSISFMMSELAAQPRRKRNAGQDDSVFSD
ncbi:MAG: PP2C family serine/threonine-protein phosphatase, partial [Pirellulales bacterium]